MEGIDKLESRGELWKSTSKLSTDRTPTFPAFIVETTKMIKPPVRNQPLCRMITAYFDLSCILGMSPFRLIASEESSELPFKLQRTWPQTLYFLLMSFLIMFFNLGDLRLGWKQSWHKLDGKDPSVHFDIATHSLLIALTICVIKEMWLNQNDFLNLLNFIGSTKSHLPEVGRRSLVTIKIVNLTYFAFVCVFNGILAEYLIFSKAGQVMYWVQMGEIGRSHVLFSGERSSTLSGNASNSSVGMDLHKNTVGEISGGIAVLIIFLLK